MTLLDLATFVCNKVNQTEDEDISACKGFLQRRFNLLWSSDLWKDALVSYTQTLSPTGYTLADTWLPTKGVLLVAPIIERVLAVRSDTRHLNVQRHEFYYRVDLDVFAKTGIPTEFLVLPPCVWEWDETVSPYLVPGGSADAAVSVTVDLLDSDQIGVTRSSVLLTDTAGALTETQRIDALLKPQTRNAVTLRAAGSITITNHDVALRAFAFSTTTSRLQAVKSWVLAAGASTAPFYGLSGASYVVAVVGGHDIAAALPTAFSGTITFDGAVFTFGAHDEADVLTVAATDTAAKIRQRVRLVQIPTATMTVRVFGKRVAPQFTDDLDSPGLTGVENCLLAFAQGDMLQRERHYAKAQSLYQEGALLLAGLKQQEAVQQAHEQRIMPEQGYGSEEWNRLYGFSF
jgi:hypothetical protein